MISDMKGKRTEYIVSSSSPEQTSWLGCMRGTGKITGDILSPAEELNAWKVLAQTEEDEAINFRRRVNLRAL